MARLDPAWVVPAAAYERVRSDYAAHVCRERARRRLRPDPHCVLQFETPEFALWHVHELLRVEGDAPTRVARTLDDVAPWCPGPGQLCATLMIDTDDAAAASRITEALAKPGAVSLVTARGVVPGRVVDPGPPGDPLWYLVFDVGSARPEDRACRMRAWGKAIELPDAVATALSEDLRERCESPALHRLFHACRGETPSYRPSVVCGARGVRAS